MDFENRTWYCIQLIEVLAHLRRFDPICRFGFTFLGLESKNMKILTRNNDVEM